MCIIRSGGVLSLLRGSMWTFSEHLWFRFKNEKCSICAAVFIVQDNARFKNNSKQWIFEVYTMLIFVVLAIVYLNEGEAPLPFCACLAHARFQHY